MRPAEQQDAEQDRAVAVRPAAHPLLVQRDEGEHAEVDVPAQAEPAEEEVERPPVVARAVDDGAGRAHGRGSVGQAEVDHRRADHARNHEQPAAAETERRGDQAAAGRAEREAEVAADREQRHAGAALLAGQDARQPRGLGMVGGDAEAGQEDREQRQRVAGRQGAAGQADRRQHDRARQQQPVRTAVRQVAEQRLRDARGDRQRQEQDAVLQVGEAELPVQEGQQHRQRALREVDGRVTDGQWRDAARERRRMEDRDRHGRQCTADAGPRW